MNETKTQDEGEALPAVPSTAWLDALWADWVRTSDNFKGVYAEQGTKYHEGYADGIYDLLTDVKRRYESASNDGDQRRLPGARNL